MTAEQQDALRRLARVRQVSQAAVFRDALDHVLAGAERARHIERARTLVGAYRSGATDVAAEHDAYLDDAFSG